MRIPGVSKAGGGLGEQKGTDNGGGSINDLR